MASPDSTLGSGASCKGWGCGVRPSPTGLCGQPEQTPWPTVFCVLLFRKVLVDLCLRGTGREGNLKLLKPVFSSLDPGEEGVTTPDL